MNSALNIGIGPRFAPYLLRFALAGLFLWFGVSQVLDPSGWTAWLPEWTASLSLTPVQIVLINGWFEIVFGAALAVGFLVQWSALILAIHTLFIAYEVGYNDIGVRDLTIALCTLALAFLGDNKASSAAHATVKPPLF